MSKRRTKKAYANLYDHPKSLFGGGPDNTGVDVILWPNGEPEMWLQTRIHSVRITASRGPYGMNINIQAHAGCAPLSIQPNSTEDGSKSCREVDITLYDDNDKARAFQLISSALCALPNHRGVKS